MSLFLLWFLRNICIAPCSLVSKMLDSGLCYTQEFLVEFSYTISSLLLIATVKLTSTLSKCGTTLLCTLANNYCICRVERECQWHGAPTTNLRLQCHTTEASKNIPHLGVGGATRRNPYYPSGGCCGVLRSLLLQTPCRK